jgi:hypothetical protein
LVKTSCTFAMYRNEMQLGSLYSENWQGKNLSRFLHVVGMALYFLAFSSFLSLMPATENLSDPESLRQEKIQSLHSDLFETESHFGVGLEVEEVEESKEENKEVSSDSFIFCAPNCILAKDYNFSDGERFSEIWKLSSSTIPLYILLQNLRFHLA